MRSIQTARRSAFFLCGILAIVVAFVLAACGTTTGSTAGNPASSSPTPLSSATGCPNSASGNTTPPANIVLNQSNGSSTVTAHVGDVVEIDLPFGQKWTGPMVSQGQLQLQTPAGFTLATSKTCVWRFTAQSLGTTQLNFYGQAICQPGQACPMYVMRLSYTVVVS